MGVFMSLDLLCCSLIVIKSSTTNNDIYHHHLYVIYIILYYFMCAPTMQYIHAFIVDWLIDCMLALRDVCC